MVNSIPRSHEYDLVIFGGGCAGLSLLTRLIHAGWTKNRKVLLVEKDAKQENDRTWCFWEKDPGFFEDIVYHQWDHLAFHSPQFSNVASISPYIYKLVRGIDFYRYCHHIIGESSGVEVITGTVTGLSVQGDAVQFRLQDQPVLLRSGLVFNSMYDEQEDKGKIKLLQHFRGWLVETTQPVFSPLVATFMDFRVSQEAGTAFAYVLPFSETMALVEYTLFSKTVLPIPHYEHGLRTYLSEMLKAGDYKIVAKEYGVIPMSDHRFTFFRKGMYYLGTAGGQTKASSGYTFQFIQAQCHAVVQCILEGRDLKTVPGTPSRFRFYDNTLLHILYHERLRGEEVFTTLFRKNRMEEILAFLDNQSRVRDEWKIIRSLPVWPFLRAAAGQLR